MLWLTHIFRPIAMPGPVAFEVVQQGPRILSNIAKVYCFATFREEEQAIKLLEE